MLHAQPGILPAIPPLARYLTFRMRPGASGRLVLARLSALDVDESLVVGLGMSLILTLEREIPGMRVFPRMVGPGASVPSTGGALWIWLRDDDRGELIHVSRILRKALGEELELAEVVDAFRFGAGLDLTGYEDGTENPTGEAAVHAAFIGGHAEGLSGSSFAAVSRWRHDLDAADAMSPGQMDATIGRRRTDNEELASAPPFAHIKRVEQESFTPPAFILRRSMPWGSEHGEGLVFVAFTASLDPLEAMLRRMVGLDDGITDGLFRFTRPVTGSTFWCPPVRGNRLDLRALGHRH